MELKGTRTEGNLKAALAGESIARNKYSYFAMAARAEGEDKAADELEAMAVNEMTHARLWFEQVFGKPGTVTENLKIAMQGEFDEWSTMYPSFAKTAREEGFEEIAVMFEHVAAIERSHEERFMKLFFEMNSNKRNKDAADIKPEEQKPAPAEAKQPGTVPAYRCMFCGASFSTRPDVCPVCKAIGSFERAEVTESSVTKL